MACIALDAASSSPRGRSRSTTLASLGQVPPRRSLSSSDVNAESNPSSRDLGLSPIDVSVLSPIYLTTPSADKKRNTTTSLPLERALDALSDRSRAVAYVTDDEGGIVNKRAFIPVADLYQLDSGRESAYGLFANLPFRPSVAHRLSVDSIDGARAFSAESCDRGSDASRILRIAREYERANLGGMAMTNGSAANGRAIMHPNDTIDALTELQEANPGDFHGILQYQVKIMASDHALVCAAFSYTLPITIVPLLRMLWTSYTGTSDDPDHFQNAIRCVRMLLCLYSATVRFALESSASDDREPFWRSGRPARAASLDPVFAVDRSFRDGIAAAVRVLVNNELGFIRSQLFAGDATVAFDAVMDFLAHMDAYHQTLREPLVQIEAKVHDMALVDSMPWSDKYDCIAEFLRSVRRTLAHEIRLLEAYVRTREQYDEFFHVLRRCHDTVFAPLAIVCKSYGWSQVSVERRASVPRREEPSPAAEKTSIVMQTPPAPSRITDIVKKYAQAAIVAGFVSLRRCGHQCTSVQQLFSSQDFVRAMCNLEVLESIRGIDTEAGLAANNGKTRNTYVLFDTMKEALAALPDEIEAHMPFSTGLDQLTFLCNLASTADHFRHGTWTAMDCSESLKRMYEYAATNAGKHRLASKLLGPAQIEKLALYLQLPERDEDDDGDATIASLPDADAIVEFVLGESAYTKRMSALLVSSSLARTFHLVRSKMNLGLAYIDAVVERAIDTDLRATDIIESGRIDLSLGLLCEDDKQRRDTSKPHPLLQELPFTSQVVQLWHRHVVDINRWVATAHHASLSRELLFDSYSLAVCVALAYVGRENGTKRADAVRHLWMQLSETTKVLDFIPETPPFRRADNLEECMAPLQDLICMKNTKNRKGIAIATTGAGVIDIEMFLTGVKQWKQHIKAVYKTFPADAMLGAFSTPKTTIDWVRNEMRIATDKTSEADENASIESIVRKDDVHLVDLVTQRCHCPDTPKLDLDLTLLATTSAKEGIDTSTTEHRPTTVPLKCSDDMIFAHEFHALLKRGTSNRIESETRPTLGASILAMYNKCALDRASASSACEIIDDDVRYQCAAIVLENVVAHASCAENGRRAHASNESNAMVKQAADLGGHSIVLQSKLRAIVDREFWNTYAYPAVPIEGVFDYTDLLLLAERVLYYAHSLAVFASSLLNMERVIYPQLLSRPNPSLHALLCAEYDVDPTDPACPWTRAERRDALSTLEPTSPTTGTTPRSLVSDARQGESPEESSPARIEQRVEQLDRSVQATHDASAASHRYFPAPLIAEVPYVVCAEPAESWFSEALRDVREDRIVDAALSLALDMFMGNGTSRGNCASDAMRWPFPSPHHRTTGSTDASTGGGAMKRIVPARPFPLSLDGSVMWDHTTLDYLTCYVRLASIVQIGVLLENTSKTMKPTDESMFASQVNRADDILSLASLVERGIRIGFPTPYDLLEIAKYGKWDRLERGFLYRAYVNDASPSGTTATLYMSSVSDLMAGDGPPSNSNNDEARDMLGMIPKGPRVWRPKTCYTRERVGRLIGNIAGATAMARKASERLSAIESEDGSASASSSGSTKYTEFAHRIRQVHNAALVKRTAEALSTMGLSICAAFGDASTSTDAVDHNAMRQNYFPWFDFAAPISTYCLAHTEFGSIEASTSEQSVASIGVAIISVLIKKVVPVLAMKLAHEFFEHQRRTDATEDDAPSFPHESVELEALIDNELGIDVQGDPQRMHEAYEASSGISQYADRLERLLLRGGDVDSTLKALPTLADELRLGHQGSGESLLPLKLSWYPSTWFGMTELDSMAVIIANARSGAEPIDPSIAETWDALRVAFEICRYILFDVHCIVRDNGGSRLDAENIERTQMQDLLHGSTGGSLIIASIHDRDKLTASHVSGLRHTARNSARMAPLLLHLLSMATTTAIHVIDAKLDDASVLSLPCMTSDSSGTASTSICMWDLIPTSAIGTDDTDRLYRRKLAYTRDTINRNAFLVNFGPGVLGYGAPAIHDKLYALPKEYNLYALTGFALARQPNPADGTVDTIDLRLHEYARFLAELDAPPSDWVRSANEIFQSELFQLVRLVDPLAPLSPSSKRPEVKSFVEFADSTHAEPFDDVFDAMTLPDNIANPTICRPIKMTKDEILVWAIGRSSDKKRDVFDGLDQRRVVLFESNGHTGGLLVPRTHCNIIAKGIQAPSHARDETSGIKSPLARNDWVDALVQNSSAFLRDHKASWVVRSMYSTRTSVPSFPYLLGLILHAQDSYQSDDQRDWIDDVAISLNPYHYHVRYESVTVRKRLSDIVPQLIRAQMAESRNVSFGRLEFAASRGWFTIPTRTLLDLLGLTSKSDREIDAAVGGLIYAPCQKYVDITKALSEEGAYQFRKRTSNSVAASEIRKLQTMRSTLYAGCYHAVPGKRYSKLYRSCGSEKMLVELQSVLEEGVSTGDLASLLAAGFTPAYIYYGVSLMIDGTREDSMRMNAWKTLTADQRGQAYSLWVFSPNAQARNSMFDLGADALMMLRARIANDRNDNRAIETAIRCADPALPVPLQDLVRPNRYADVEKASRYYNEFPTIEIGKRELDASARNESARVKVTFRVKKRVTDAIAPARRSSQDVHAPSPPPTTKAIFPSSWVPSDTLAQRLSWIQGLLSSNLFFTALHPATDEDRVPCSIALAECVLTVSVPNARNAAFRALLEHFVDGAGGGGSRGASLHYAESVTGFGSICDRSDRAALRVREAMDELGAVFDECTIPRRDDDEARLACAHLKKRFAETASTRMHAAKGVAETIRDTFCKDVFASNRKDKYTRTLLANAQFSLACLDIELLTARASIYASLVKYIEETDLDELQIRRKLFYFHTDGLVSF